MDFNNLFDVKNFPSDETLKAAEKDGRTNLFDEKMNKA